MGFLSFDIFPILFVIVFALVLISFVVILGSGLRRWNKNNHSPRLTVSATVVSKRMDVSGHVGSSTGSMNHGRCSTSYYVTFQVESGDRMELWMSGQEYGMLIEGDHGDLSFQGTRYLGFERM